MRSIQVLVLSLFFFNVSIAKTIRNSNAVNALQPKADPITIGIYYSPYNEVSMNFLKDQGEGKNGIWDLMLPTATGLEVDFVPWGLSTKDGTTYACTDGDTDCLATRLHACAIKLHDESDEIQNHQIFHFIVCTVAHPDWKTNPTESVDQCINQLGEWPDEANPVVICAKDAAEESNGHLDAMKEKTDALNPKPTKVPWVLLGTDRNENAEQDLKAAVCAAQPDLCSETTNPGDSSTAPPGDSSTGAGGDSSTGAGGDSSTGAGGDSSTGAGGDSSTGAGGGSSTGAGEGSSTSTPNAEDLRVGIYYSPYNEGSMNFLKDQGEGKNGIWDLMLPTAKGLELDFVPWGLSTKEGDTYTCTDGETDCLATRLHACAIKMHDEYDEIENHEIFHFLICTVEHQDWKTNPTESVDQCVNRLGEWPDGATSVVICAKDAAEESNKHLDDMKQKTDALNPKLTKVPWVLLGTDRNENAEQDLKTAICAARPDICSGGGDTTTPGSGDGDGGGAAEIISNKFFSFIVLLFAIIAVL